jgi:hypothetical protein
MTQSLKDLRSFSNRQDGLSLKDQYKMIRGIKADWGIDGYIIPKTNLYLKKDHKFPKEKRTDAMTIAMKRSQEPDPSKYSPDFQTTLKTNWVKSYGKFLTAKKKTIIDDVMKQSKTLPGPGDYFKEEKKMIFKNDIRYTLCSKTDRLSFLSTVQALSSEIPCSWQYNPHQVNLKKNTSDWRRAKDKDLKEKEKVGPGYYQSVDKASTLVLPSSKKYSFQKSNPPNAISLTAYYTRKYPGVGNYPEAYKISSMEYLCTKSSRKIIHPYKTKRYIDNVIKYAATVPGPGTYNIGPPKEEKKVVS